MVRRLNPAEPADRLQMARNASVMAITLYAVVAAVLVATAILHPALVIRVVAGTAALFCVIALAYHAYLYRYLSNHPETQIEVPQRRQPPVSRSSSLFVIAAFVGITLLAFGGRLHKAVVPHWRFPLPQQPTAVTLAVVGIAFLIVAAAGIVFVNLRKNHQS